MNAVNKIQTTDSYHMFDRNGFYQQIFSIKRDDLLLILNYLNIVVIVSSCNVTIADHVVCLS